MNFQTLNQRLFFFGLLFGLTSCAQIPLPPSKERVAELKARNSGGQSPSERYALSAQKTLNENPLSACEGWRELQESDFPLKDLVSLEVLKCEKDLNSDEFNKKLSKLIEEAPTWLHTPLYRTFNSHSKVNANNATKLLLLGVQQMETREEKVSALLEQKEKLSSIDSEHPLLEKVQQKLVEVAPRFSKEITQKNTMEVARDYERARKFEKARKLYQNIIHSDQFTFKEKVKAWERKALTFKLQRDKVTYTAETQELAEFVEKSFRQNPDDRDIQKEWYHRQVESLRALWTQNETSKAYNNTEKLFRDHENSLLPLQKAKLNWLMGLMAKEKKRNGVSLQHLKKAADYSKQNGENEGKEDLFRYYWTYSWELYKQEEMVKAIQSFKDIPLEQLNETEKAKVFFWLGMIHEKLSLPELAKKHYKKAFRHDPYSYYGLLGGSYAQVPPPRFEQYLEPERKLPKVEWMLFLNQPKLVRDYLNQNFSDMGAIEKKSSLAYFHRAGHYHDGLRKYFQLSDELSEGEKEVLFPALYPYAWPDSLKKVSQRQNVREGLLLSVIRQESAFDFKARSWADAFGLMQITPERAKHLSKEHNIPYRTYTDLYDITTNLEFGATLLKRLQKEFDNQFPLYVAAYNASSSAIRHWMKTRYEGDYLTFIEDIPYEETRNYIKYVFRNFLIYEGMKTNSLLSRREIEKTLEGTM